MNSCQYTLVRKHKIWVGDGMNKELHKCVRIEKQQEGSTIYPFSLTRIRETTYGTGFNHVAQQIAEHEIYICVQGEATACIGEQTYPVTPGTIVLYNPNEIHELYTTSLEPYDRYVLLFHYSEVSSLWKGIEHSLLSMFSQREQYQNNLLRLHPHEFQHLISMLEKALSYQSNSNGEDDALLYAQFFKILHFLNQKYLQYANKQETNYHFPIVAKALNLINEQFVTLQQVEDLASQLHISNSYLARVFKRQVGTSVYEYIRNMKFAYAVKLLSEGHSVTQACFDSGFNSYSHFIQMFKRRYGTTPHKYQKNI